MKLSGSTKEQNPSKNHIRKAYFQFSEISKNKPDSKQQKIMLLEMNEYQKQKDSIEKYAKHCSGIILVENSTTKNHKDQADILFEILNNSDLKNQVPICIASQVNNLSKNTDQNQIQKEYEEEM